MEAATHVASIIMEVTGLPYFRNTCMLQLPAIGCGIKAHVEIPSFQEINMDVHGLISIQNGMYMEVA
jgi:hypothetical protein